MFREEYQAYVNRKQYRFLTRILKKYEEQGGDVESEIKKLSKELRSHKDV